MRGRWRNRNIELYRVKADDGERLKVQANPAKSFFVSMLIKDITLRDAIGDLVDNAVDAIKACVADKNNLSGYRVEVTLV